jgi:hypothetical protein
MNGLLKVPMQFCILLIGILVFAYYQYHTPPLFFNEQVIEQLENSNHKQEYENIKQRHEEISQQKTVYINQLTDALKTKEEEKIDQARAELLKFNENDQKLRTELVELIEKNDPNADTNDNNYIFLRFVTDTFPKGLIGLLIAIIFLASMGATASAINSLSSTTVIDIYKRFVKKGAADSHYLKVSRISTFCWGIFTIGIALYSSQLGNLLEAVNILGSLFYGTILGIFLVAFYVKSIGGKAVFWSAVITEVIVIGIWRMDIVAFLWLNLIGCALLILIGFILQYFLGKNNTQIKTV